MSFICFLFGFDSLELFLRDHTEFHLIFQKEVLISILLLKLLLEDSILSDVFLSLESGLEFLLLNLLGCVELFLLLSLLCDILALFDFPLPELLNSLEFVVLLVLQGAGDLVQEEGT